MADSDLEQYNGTASFPATADVGTNADPFLEPTDAPLISANDNGFDEAPVNKALRRCKDLLLGIRGAIVGDFAGAVQKTLRSVYADLTGGVTHAKPDGTIWASGPSGGLGDAIVAENGDINCPNGTLRSGSQAIMGDPSATNCTIQAPLLRFKGTSSTASGSNPPQGTAFKNTLRAINIPKADCYIEMSAANTISGFDGHNIAAVTVATPGLRIQFSQAFDDAKYKIGIGPRIPVPGVVGGTVYVVEKPGSRLPGEVILVFYDSADNAIDPVVKAINGISVFFSGRQTS